jgi:hypothetical protein
VSLLGKEGPAPSEIVCAFTFVKKQNEIRAVKIGFLKFFILFTFLNVINE